MEPAKFRDSSIDLDGSERKGNKNVQIMEPEDAN